MSLETLVAGRYSNTYNAVDTGISEGGYELQQESNAEVINQTDAYARSIIDLVYQGGQVYLGYTSKAYKAGSITPFWPWGALGVMLTTAAPIGRLASNVAAASVLTATAGTPAAAAPATLTATLSILAPNYPARLLYSSVVRNVPIRLLCLPFDAGGGTIKWFA